MNLKQLIRFFYCSLLIIGLVSCGASREDKSKNSEEFDKAGESLKEHIEEIVYEIPAPSEIPYLLQATGAEFNESLLNSIRNVDRYTTLSNKAALNLGVYAADVGYLSSYDKTQESIDYLTACKSLGDNLGLIGTFDADVVESFERNISNKDSLAFLLDKTIKRAESYLKDDNRNRLSSLVITGSFIEGLYISTGVIKTYPKDILPEDSRNLILTPIMRIVLEQKKAVSELLKMLNAAGHDGSVAGIIEDLKRLEETYEQLNIEEQIRNNRADLVLSDKNLVGITEIVEKIRNEITK